jgi:hypothetical protein
VSTRPPTAADAEAQLLGELRFSASLCTSALTGGDMAGEESLAAAAHLVAAADRTLHRFVAESRAQGLSWARIGATLGITRQAAQKRFSSPPQRVRAPSQPPDADLVSLAVEVMDRAAAGDPAFLDSLAGARMRRELGEGGVGPLLQGLEPIFGRRLSRTEPSARVIAQVAVVSAREHRELADAIVRVSLTADGQLLGLHYDFAPPKADGESGEPSPHAAREA